MTRGIRLRQMTLVMACVSLLVSSRYSRAEVLQACSAVNVRAVALDDGWVLMRDDGRILTKERYCSGDEYSGGLIRFERCIPGQPSQSVYVKTTGEIALTINAEHTGPFSQGLAAIESDEKLWGYMNDSGKIVIPPRFNRARPFSEGEAAVDIDGRWRYIDMRGRIVLAPRFPGWKLVDAHGFKSGGAFVLFFDPKTNRYFKALIDHSGRWIVRPTPDLVGQLDEGLAPLWSGRPPKLGFIDSSGRVAISPMFTGTAEVTFQEGLAVAYVGEAESRRAGFIDKTGHWIIDPTFENAYHFCNGLAPVELDGKWGFVDTRGQLSIPIQYDDADCFDGGIATVYIRDAKGTVHQAWINGRGALLYKSSRETKIIEVDGH